MAFAIASVLLVAAAPAVAQVSAPGAPGDGRSALGHPGTPSAAGRLEENVFEVYLRQTSKLSSGILAYVDGEDTLLPLQEVMILLEFAIKETPSGASGWYIDESRTFKLDVQAGTVSSAGQTFTVRPGGVRRIDNQLYVTARELTAWLPLDFHADPRALTLHINPREVTPKETREQRLREQQVGAIYQYRSENPKMYTPYSFIQVPAIEADLGVGYGRTGHETIFSSGTIRAFGDFLFMNGEAFLTSNGRTITDARIRLGRVDPDGGLLGPLNATSFQVGDVTGTAVPLVASNFSGRGVTVTSRPYGYVAEFDRVTIEDSVPSGWEVQLYRNNVLLSFQPPSANGRFRFDNVPLLRGPNEIRLEFYGPQGQRRTETRQYFVGQTQVPVGSFNYDVSVAEVGKSVFGFHNFYAANRLYANTALGGALRLDYGLTRNMTVTAGFAAAPLPIKYGTERAESDYRTYGTLGLRTRIGNFFVALDGAVDDRSGWAGGISTQTAIDDWTVSARSELYQNRFVSDASLAQSQTNHAYTYRTSHSTARVEKTFSPFASGLFLNWGVVGGYTTYEHLAPSWRAGTTTGATYGPVSIINDLYYGGAITRGNQGVFGTVTANLRLWHGIGLRASTDYDLRKVAEVNGYSFGLTAPLPDTWTLGLGYTLRFDRYSDIERTQSYYASLKRRFDLAEVGIIGSYGNYDVRQTYVGSPLLKDDYRVMLTLSFSTFTDPRSLATRVSSDRIARQGAIRADTYLDDQKGGWRTEQPLDGVRVVYAGQREPYATGDPSRPHSGAVGAGAWTDVAIDRTSLTDPTLSPAGRGVAVLPRPGVVSEVRLPVVAKAGIEGRAQMLVGRERRALPNVRIQIVKSSGAEQKVIAEVSTEYDGSFSLADVPVGTYVIRIEPDQARQIGASKPVEQPITLVPETGILDGLVLILDRS